MRDRDENPMPFGGTIPDLGVREPDAENVKGGFSLKIGGKESAASATGRGGTPA